MRLSPPHHLYLRSIFTSKSYPHNSTTNAVQKIWRSHGGDIPMVAEGFQPWLQFTPQTTPDVYYYLLSAFFVIETYGNLGPSKGLELSWTIVINGPT